jgi:AcrR family transcriptional regulator
MVDFWINRENGMLGIREQKKRKTRNAIMEAAIRLFSEKGFEKTSIEQLARTAGIGKGTIYSYFQTKTEIFHAFCEDELDFIHSELLAKTDPDALLIEQLMVLFIGEFNLVSKKKEFGRLLMQQMVFPVETDHVKTRKIDDRWLTLVFSICRRAQERNELRRDIDLLYIASHFYGLYITTISAWYSGRIQTEEVGPGLRILFQQALDGLAPPDGARKTQQTV